MSEYDRSSANFRGERTWGAGRRTWLGEQLQMRGLRLSQKKKKKVRKKVRLRKHIIKNSACPLCSSGAGPFLQCWFHLWNFLVVWVEQAVQPFQSVGHPSSWYFWDLTVQLLPTILSNLLQAPVFRYLSCTSLLPFAQKVISHLPVLLNCYRVRSSLPFRRLHLTYSEAYRTRLSRLLPVTAF